MTDRDQLIGEMAAKIEALEARSKKLEHKADTRAQEVAVLKTQMESLMRIRNALVSTLVAAIMGAILAVVGLKGGVK